MHIFDVLGPVMIGPSSSHTAGAVKIGYVTRKLLGEAPVQANILLHGSFADTGSGHGTDRAVVAGLLGCKPDDPHRFRPALKRQKSRIFLSDHQGYTAGSSPQHSEDRSCRRTRQPAGSNRFVRRRRPHRICEIDGIRTDFSGEYNTIIVHNTDTPGHVAQVTTVLAQKNVNIAAMQLYRNTKGGYAVMILECDDRIPPDMVRWLSGLDGILKITSYNAEEDV